MRPALRDSGLRGSLLMLTILVGVLVGVLAALHPIQLPAEVSGKAAEDGLSAWVPALHVGH